MNKTGGVKSQKGFGELAGCYINFSMFHGNHKYGLLGSSADFLRCSTWEKSFYKIASMGAEDDCVTSEPVGLKDHER